MGPRVSNPPHFIDSGIGQLRYHDPDWRVHRGFFGRIARHLKPGGVVVLQENNAGSTPATFAPMIAEAGLKLVFEQNASPTRTDGLAHVLSRHHAACRCDTRLGGRLMRILAIHAGIHDASTAAFDDYNLVAAVSEERLTRIKGYGQSVPWLGIDEVLRIAGWSRSDVDAIALTRGFHPTYHLRVPLWRELRYAIERVRGTGRDYRDLAILGAPLRHRRHIEYLSRRALPARQRFPRRHEDSTSPIITNCTRLRRCFTPTGTMRWSTHPTASATTSATRCVR